MPKFKVQFTITNILRWEVEKVIEAKTEMEAIRLVEQEETPDRAADYEDFEETIIHNIEEVKENGGV